MKGSQTWVNTRNVPMKLVDSELPPMPGSDRAASISHCVWVRVAIQVRMPSFARISFQA